MFVAHLPLIYSKYHMNLQIIQGFQAKVASILEFALLLQRGIGEEN